MQKSKGICFAREQRCRGVNTSHINLMLRVNIRNLFQLVKPGFMELSEDELLKNASGRNAQNTYMLVVPHCKWVLVLL